MIILMTLLEQTLSAIVENSKELIRSLINRFLDELPQIYRTKILFSSKNKLVSC